MDEVPQLHEAVIAYPRTQQGSDEWFKIRQGVATASQFNRIVTAKTQKLSESRWELMDELLAERYIPATDFSNVNFMFTGQKFIGNQFTDHGNIYEPEARQHFSDTWCAINGCEIETVGFIAREDRLLGCSPDGIIRNADGEIRAGWEAKCKCLKNHIAVVRTGAIPDAHLQQIHGSMIVTGLNEWHFYSYFPGKQPVHIIVMRDEYTARMEEALDDFIIEFAEMLRVTVPKLDGADNAPEAIEAIEAGESLI